MPEPTRIPVEVDGRRLTISNLDKVLFPATRTTKGEVLDYYARIAPVMLPHLADRPVTRIRWPHGVEKPSFYEKNAPAGTPSWVRIVEVPTSGGRTTGESGVLRFPVIDDLATLTWLANLAALELHVHQWRASDRLADRLVVDLDPGEPAGLQECCQVALEVADLASTMGVDARPVLSGSKGLHIYFVLSDGMESEEANAVARELANQLHQRMPRLVTTSMNKAERKGRVFVDWSQNSAAKTTVSPYSLRGRRTPTVAAPVTWSEVEVGAEDELGIEQMSFTMVLDRVREHGDYLLDFGGDR